MSQAGATGKATGAAAIFTISGNDGVHESPIGGNFSFLTANSTVKFRGSPGTETLDFGLQNLFLGSSAPSLTTGTNNTFLGIAAGNALTSSNSNIGIGPDALVMLTTNGAANGENTAIGYTCMPNLVSGTNNIGIGSQCGINYTSTESNNILINHHGVLGESNTIRIGTAGSTLGEQDRAFLAGVTGVTVAASSPVLVDSNGQLSDGGFGTAAQVWTSNGAGVSPSWQPAGGGGFTPVNWSVRLSGNVANVTGDGTDYAILYDTVTFDSATGYDTVTGLYTFATTGIYQINVLDFVFGGSVADTVFIGFLLINGVTNIRLFDANPGSLGLATNSEFMSSAAFLYSATAGDTIGVHVVVAGGLKDVGVAGGSQSCLFNGYRVG